MMIALPLEPIQTNKITKKPIGLMPPPCRYQEFSSSTAQPPEQGYNRRQVQPSTENFEIPELGENSEEEQFTDFDSFMTIIIHTKPMSIYSKNTFPIYKIWTMTNIMLKLTEPIFLSIHQLHNTITQQTTKKLHDAPWEELKRIFGRGRGQAR